MLSGALFPSCGRYGHQRYQRYLQACSELVLPAQQLFPVEQLPVELSEHLLPVEQLWPVEQ